MTVITMTENYAVFKTKFEDQLNSIIMNKNRNNQIYDREAYIALIRDIKIAKCKKTGKSPKDYVRLHKFDIKNEDGVEKLIVKDETDKEVRYYVPTDEIFDIMYQIHMETNHGRRHTMTNKLYKYKNITREMITLLLKCCEVCKSKISAKRICCIAIISMPEVNGYKYTLVHKELDTKFIQLRPLKTKKYEEIVNALLDIYTIFGAPFYLTSVLGREFTKNIILLLNNMWPDVKIDISNEDISQIRKMLDPTVAEIQSLLSAWLTENSTQTWVQGLKFVQFLKNKKTDGTKKSPFQAMFNSLTYGEETYKQFNYENVHTEETSNNVLIKEEIDIKIEIDDD